MFMVFTTGDSFGLLDVMPWVAHDGGVFSYLPRLDGEI